MTTEAPKFTNEQIQQLEKQIPSGLRIASLHALAGILRQEYGITLTNYLANMKVSNDFQSPRVGGEQRKK